MDRINIAIIGGGVIGLSIAERLSRSESDVYVFERNSNIGMETSSRNSGVIHSGIYYPPGSLKATLSVKGRDMIYRLCEKRDIQCKKIGKLIVGSGENAVVQLERLLKNGEANGVNDLSIKYRDEIKKIEPKVEADYAIYSPSSGIMEPYDLLTMFRSKAERQGVLMALRTEITSLRFTGSDFEISGISSGSRFTVAANTVINAAGLYSDRIAWMAGIDIDSAGYRLHYCKGDYFRVSGKPPIKSLVYPLPQEFSLGIHLSPDMAGSLRLGPNAYYVDRIDYRIESDPREFIDGVRDFIPSVSGMDIHPDSSGIRPKLQGPYDGFRDFIIKDESSRGLYGLINLIGIESPGLTASPAIGDFVADMYFREIKG